MSNRSIGLDPRLYDYLLAASLREHPVLARLRAATASHPQANMQIAPEQGQFMALLARLTKLRPEQAKYLGVEADGPYKPDHYRY